MKKCKIAKILMVICLVLGVALIPINQLKVQAAEVIATVQGTILSGTTSELLKLSTKEGEMIIKLDSGTDTSGFKILLPGKKVYVSVSHGSDGYLHAVKITSDAQTDTVTVDSSTTATVTGKISEKSKDDLIYFSTAQGEMQIKLDPTTNMSDCAFLVMGKTYYITCARGSDAYMHATSISDKSAEAAVAGSNVAEMSVTGTVSSKTKENLLYLSTKGGEMQFVIDSNADTSRGRVLTSGNELTVSFYHGSDAYLHAVAIVGTKDSSTATVDTSSTMTVTGTVRSKSTENLLYLDTDQGLMELKLDAVSSVNNCKVFVSGKKLTVTCARGSDAYMHAIDITGK